MLEAQIKMCVEYFYWKKHRNQKVDVLFFALN